MLWMIYNKLDAKYFIFKYIFGNLFCIKFIYIFDIILVGKKKYY